MHAIRQKCRPKHQVLVLKCYPRTTKGAVDVKPNSSELSYLLYYATTRRSKVQKVGDFLEKKTASDVWRARIGNVQVTLQILAALIEKAPKDLPLYASFLLHILNSVLRSNDITMVEATLPTWQAFCEHHDGASLAADQGYVKLYEEIVRLYASFASTRPPSTKTSNSPPVVMRWRLAGLEAIKSMSSSEALSSVTGRQLSVTVPVILENIWTDNAAYLDTLIQRVHVEEKVGAEKLLRRRTSVATVRTTDTSTDPNSLALAGTVADADKLAEEDIGVLAMQCLRLIFLGNNRAQIRGATLATTSFIEDRLAQKEVLTNISTATGEDRGWATKVFLAISRWAPVQDRYIILVTAMDILLRSPLRESSFTKQLVLATMIGSLLRSDVNLIGLSIMDILLGLIQHILRLLQLGSGGANVQLQDVGGDSNVSPNVFKEPSPSQSTTGAPITEKAVLPSNTRRELLLRLQHCMGDLATHVYYADQIPDMISAILLRLKPATNSAISSPVSAIEDPETTTNVLSASGNLNEDPKTSDFFSFDTAKVIALEAIKSIIVVANKRKTVVGGTSLARNRIGLRVWDGTQWLLRDRDGRVRLAYVDALLTWLNRELTAADLRVFDDNGAHPSQPKNVGSHTTHGMGSDMAKRAVSSASHRERMSKSPRTTFLQLLHLAIYENAIDYVAYESDIVMLHLLLVTLVNKLGINAVKSGLPMICRLQEDIQDAETMAKVRMGSLCHGYFWAVSEKFDFDSSRVGVEIYNEITRRRGKGFWVDMIRIPATTLDTLGMPGQIASDQQQLPLHAIQSESLRPFDGQVQMVDLICVAYSESMTSPPSSPPSSPGRSFSHPILSTSSPTNPVAEHNVPAKVKEEALAEWSRETVIATAQESSKTASLNGSRAGTTHTGRNPKHLVVNDSIMNGGIGSGAQSPRSPTDANRSRPASQAYGRSGGLGNIQKFRQSSLRDGSPAGASDSSYNSVARIDHLKRVLSGEAPPSAAPINMAHSDASSESMVSYDGTPSEMSYDNRAATLANDPHRRVSADASRSISRDRGPGSGLGSHPFVTANLGSRLPEANEEGEALEDVPPVPPLPKSLSTSNRFLPGGEHKDATVDSTNTAVLDYASRDGQRSDGARAAQSMPTSRGAPNGAGRDVGQHSSTKALVHNGHPAGKDTMTDLETMLRGIDTGSAGQAGLVGRGPL